MTTIVYRDGVMAGDRRVTNGHVIEPEVTKIFKRESDGALIGAAGTLGLAARFTRWFLQGEKGDPPELFAKEGDCEAEAIIVRPNCRSETHYKYGVIHLESEYYAIGSGACAALTALDLGCSAEDAVRAAARRDTGTGAEIDVLKLGAIAALSPMPRDEGENTGIGTGLDAQSTQGDSQSASGSSDSDASLAPSEPTRALADGVEPSPHILPAGYNAWPGNPRPADTDIVICWMGGDDFVGPLKATDFDWNCEPDPIRGYQIVLPQSPERERGELEGLLGDQSDLSDDEVRIQPEQGAPLDVRAAGLENDPLAAALLQEAMDTGHADGPRVDQFIPHDWVDGTSPGYGNITTCKVCGRVKRASNEFAPCPEANGSELGEASADVERTSVVADLDRADQTNSITKPKADFFAKALTQPTPKPFSISGLFGKREEA